MNMVYTMTVSVSPEDLSRCAHEYSQEFDMPIAEIRLRGERAIHNEISESHYTFGRNNICKALAVEVCIYQNGSMLCSLDLSRNDVNNRKRIKWNMYKTV